MPRPQISQRRYAARRIGALAALGVVLVGLVLVAQAIIGSGGADTTAGPIEGATGPNTGNGAAVGSDDSGGSDLPSSPDDPASGAATSGASDASGDVAAPADPRPVPSPSDPARVLILGDSDAGTFGPYLSQLLEGTGVVRTQLDYKVSSGLARPDFFDWNRELETKVASFDPDIVVVTFGGNDGQALTDAAGDVVVGVQSPSSDSSRWTAEYRARVRSIVEILERAGVDTVWVGIPNHINPEVSFRMQLQDEAVKAELAEHSEVRFVDTWTRFAGRSGNFAELVIDPRDGVGKPVRASDGFHLNQTGAEILAVDIAQVVYELLRARGAAI